MAIIKCPECGHQINEKEKICPVCGVEIAGHVVRCLTCGEVYFIDEALCPNCHSSRYTILGIDQPAEPKPQVVVEQVPEKKEEVKEEESVPPSETTDHPEPSPQTSNTPQDEEPKEVVEDNPPIADTPKTKTKREKEHKKEEARHTSERPTPTKADLLAPIPDDEDEEETDAEDKDTMTEGQQGNSLKRNFIPFIVSIAVALLVAAISMYYYQETKITKENNDFERAVEHNDTTMMHLFLSSYPHATQAHVDTIQQRLQQIRLNEKELTEAYAKRDKTALLDYLHNHPSTQERQKILLLVDSIDWDSTLLRNNRQAYQDYLTAHADGQFADIAKEKLSDKVLEATQADRDMMGNLFRNFFLSVNANEESRLTANLNNKVSNFMGTENATHSQVVAWMKQQHKEDVKSVIWRLNRDYSIKKKEVGGVVQYAVDFTAQRDIVHTSGKTSTEHFRISSDVTADGKITSMNMSTYTPKPKEATTSSSETPKQSTTANKPANTPTQKPAAKPESKPAAKPAAAKPAATNTTTPKAPVQKPASQPATTNGKK